MERNSQPRCRGLTLVELLCALAIAALLSVTALPTFSAVRHQLLAFAEINRLLAAMRLARSTAVNARSPVSLCPAAADGDGGWQCGGVFSRGWIVFINPDRDPHVDAGRDHLLRVASELPGGYRLTDRSGRSEMGGLITFMPDGRSHRSLTLRLCSPLAAAPSRSVVLSRAGRARQQRDAAPCT